MGAAVLAQPLYSPDLASLNFFLFPRTKRTLKETLHGTLDAVKAAVTASLKEVAVGNFRGTFIVWVKRWQCSIKAGGGHFKSLKIVFE